jgi:hypothetical protein
MKKAWKGMSFFNEIKPKTTGFSLDLYKCARMWSVYRNTDGFRDVGSEVCCVQPVW